MVWILHLILPLSVEMVWIVENDDDDDGVDDRG